MKNSISVLFVLFFILFGCTKKSSISDLEVKDGLYYLKGTTTLYSGKIESKYSTGKDSISGSVVNGKFDGVVISYYQNGNIKDSVDYKMGERKISKSYTEDGSPVCDCNEIYYNDSKEVWMTSSSEKVFDGKCITYWDNKNKKSSKVVKHGKVRESYEWYENGNEKESLIYNEEGKFKSKFYGYQNGKPKQKEVFENGTVKTNEGWYENGNQKQKINYENGTVKTNEGWYENGKQEFIYYGEKEILRNTLKGGSKEWFENGNLKYEKLESPIETGIYCQKDEPDIVKIDGIFYDTDGNIKEIETIPRSFFSCLYLTKQEEIGVNTKSIDEFIQGMKNYLLKWRNGSYIK